MVGPEAIVQQVWQRVVPTDWKILRGKRRSAFSLGLRAAAWTCAALIALTLAAVAALRAGLMGKTIVALPATIAGYSALLVASALVVALPLLVGNIVTITAAIRNAGDHEPLIVLLPKGFVEYANRRQPIIGILYAELASVEYRRQPTRRRARLWLDLFFRDGHKERWRPRADFGPPQPLYEAISKAHALYQILYEGRD
jgi:hypothetical protein